MIRRKIWATATFCMAIAGAAQAQSSPPVKASLGLPQKEAAPYLARGVAPNAGYPKYVPRNYIAPTPPGYSASAQLGPATSGAVSSPVELFAVEAETPPTTGPVPMTIPAGPATVGPPPSVVNPPMHGAPMDMGTPMMGTPMMGTPIGGGPMIGDAPYLDGVGGYSDGALPTVWFTGEFVNWRLKGVKVPPLVSTAPAGSSGTITDTATYVSYGGDDILKGWQSGFRVRGGFWFPDGQSGLDLGFFTTGNVEEKTLAGSNGDQGLFRPFFNTAIRSEDARLVAFTDPIGGPLFGGRVATEAVSNMVSFEANYRTGLGMGFGGKLDGLVGYRYLSLSDRIDIQSRASTLVPLGPVPAGTAILTEDRFESTNTFNGGQVGLVGEWMLGSMTFGFRGTVGVGVNNQRVDIGGLSNSLTPAGNSVTSIGGVLAQPTNIGIFERSRVSILPEVGITLGYQCSNNIRVFGGVNGMYLTNVARAGEQINRNVNATFIADPTTGVRNSSGAAAPTFHFRDDTFWAYGYSVGVEFRW